MWSKGGGGVAGEGGGWRGVLGGYQHNLKRQNGLVVDKML